VKMSFDSSSGQMDQQSGHQHLSNRDDVTSHDFSRLEHGQQHWKIVTTPPSKTAAHTCKCTRLSTPAQLRGETKGPQSVQTPLAEHQAPEELIGVDDNILVLLFK